MYIPKYLMAVDPFEEGDDQSEFIISTQEPTFIAKIEPISLDLIDKRPSSIFHDILYLNSTGDLEVFRAEVKRRPHLEEDGEFTTLSALVDMEKWYIRYLKETDVEEGVEPGLHIKEFSSGVAGVKVVYISESATWMLYARGILTEFRDEESLDAFLVDDLDIPRDLVDSGLINRI